jgi:hypothetical protein
MLQQRNPEHAMGRPPIGKVAMTATERSRRYRARLTAGPAATKPVGPATKPVGPATKPTPDRRDEQIAQLKARVAELEQAQHGDEQLKARIVELEAALKETGRGFIWTARQYRDVEFCAHPDRIAHLRDEALSARFDAAFRTVKSSKGILVDKDAEERHEQSEKFRDEVRERMGKVFAKRAAREEERQAKARASRSRDSRRRTVPRS